MRAKDKEGAILTTATTKDAFLAAVQEKGRTAVVELSVKQATALYEELDSFLNDPIN